MHPVTSRVGHDRGQYARQEMQVLVAVGVRKREAELARPLPLRRELGARLRGPPARGEVARHDGGVLRPEASARRDRREPFGGQHRPLFDQREMDADVERRVGARSAGGLLGRRGSDDDRRAAEQAALVRFEDAVVHRLRQTEIVGVKDDLHCFASGFVSAIRSPA
jgi:hypothetical protein